MSVQVQCVRAELSGLQLYLSPITTHIQSAHVSYPRALLNDAHIRTSDITLSA